ncbi:adhesion G-protein coupled receptor F3 [Genypterus blacodes]|uniref:adhesion G-protein coupled receptor F3 n=1 Tax=Genypterus blacodes TaxID=154954 RepID=UPI003F758F12
MHGSCGTVDFPSCDSITLQKVTGIWEGLYECRFTSGSITHTARSMLTVALLPDEITLTIDPLTADCSEKTSADFINVVAVATILNSTEDFRVTGFYREQDMGLLTPELFSSCVNEELALVLDAAENFKKGLGATQEVAMTIFANLANNSNAPLSETEDDMADLTASIDVLNVMAGASKNVVLQEGILPNLVDAASTMLNQSWAAVNTSVIEGMSSNYLVSLEGLVKHIHVNTSSGLISENLDLQFCSEAVCNMTVFDINVNLNRSTGTVKTVAVKNIMDKLRNNYRKTEPTSLLLSATLVGNNDSSIHISLDFPTLDEEEKKAYCVFFNTTIGDFSDDGCYSSTAEPNRTVCICSHLTSFSVLMSKNADVLPFLDEITYVGLGVSLCSLVVLLIIESLVWTAVVKSNLSHFRHTSLVNISLCLLLANCCFLASSFPDKISATMCLSFTLLKHFFYLAMFCWMLCLSVMLVHQLIFVFSPLRKRVFMFLSSIVGYIVPILMVGSSFVYYKYTDQPYHKKETCWLTFNGLLDGSLHAFILPMGAIVFTNMFSMGVVILTLVKTSIPEGGNADKETAKSVLKVVIFLTPVFGVTWAFGFIMLLLDDDSPMRPFFVYAFTILNSFQGLLILLTACFAEQKVREELFKIIMGPNSDAKKNPASKGK